MKRPETKVLSLLIMAVLVMAGWWAVDQVGQAEPAATPGWELTVGAPHTGAPLKEEGVTLETDRSVYPTDAEWISITVGVDDQVSGGWGECGHPRLELLRDGVWHILEPNPVLEEALNALTVAPGEEETFGLGVRNYATVLEPGRYRAVFDKLCTDDYYAVEFDVTA